MLNNNNERELCYVVKVEEIRPLEGYDRVEYARIGAGWWVVVRKNQFKVGDCAVYFEIDSKVPEREPFMFLEPKKFKIKTQKMCKVVSQGLLMSFEDFGWEPDKYKEGDFLTKELNVTYATVEDNQRKAPSDDKYKKMSQRHQKIFKQKWARWMMRRNWGRKIMFFFFGKKKDKKTGWPDWIKKTDEERCQNMPWLFPGNEEEWIATEKIDGTSTTFAMKGYGRKREFYVCSRNVVFDKPNKKCFYDTNVYTEMAEKYHMEEALSNAMAYWKNTPSPVDYVIIQGETYGGNIQKRNYGDEHRLAIFNVIFGFKNGEVKRLNPFDMCCFLLEIQPENAPKLEGVPIVDRHFRIPETCEELLNIASGESAIDGGMREGLVIRSKGGFRSFKAVSNDFLLKYHS